MNNPFILAIASMQALNTKPATAAVERTITKQVLNPEGLALRVFKDGRVFPSQELVDTYNLEYQLEGEQPNPAQGFDLFMAHDLPNFDKSIPNCLLVAPIAKSEGKVDLFKSTEYNEDGSPKSSVLTQGSNTFGKRDLIPMLEVVLNQDSATIFKENKFVDLIVESAYPLPIATEFLYVPKTIRKGPRKGEIETVRRNSNKVFPITVLSAQIATSTLTEQESADNMQQGEEAPTPLPQLDFHTV